MKKKTKKKEVYKLFTLNEDKLELVELDLTFKMDFINKFGTENIPATAEFNEWVDTLK
jgi:hypothetical protein